MDIFFPTDIDQTLDILDSTSIATIMAGGTDLMVRKRAGFEIPETIVCLEKVAGLGNIEVTGNYIRIGAAASITDILDSKVIKDKLFVLHQAASMFASPLVRNMATIGGNICTASPAADTLPPLFVLDAEVELVSPAGIRKLLINDFITGPGKTVLRQKEFVRSVIVPVPQVSTKQYYEKVGRRKAMAIAVVNLAVLLNMEDEIVLDIRLAFGSVAPTTIRCRDAEEIIKGRTVSREVLHEAAAIVARSVFPIDDIRASAEYRRKVAANLLFRIENIQNFAC